MRCAYLLLIPLTHGGMAQAKQTWVPGSVPRWFTHVKTVNHPRTNRAWRRVMTQIETDTLLLSQIGNQRKKQNILKIPTKKANKRYIQDAAL